VIRLARQTGALAPHAEVDPRLIIELPSASTSAVVMSQGRQLL
jgi:hypothetical protein